MKPLRAAIGQVTVPRLPSGTRSFRSQPIQEMTVNRLTRSMFLRIANNAELGAALRLWVQAWGERPSGSVPNDRRWLADVTKLGDRWSSHAEVVLHGLQLCNDGRWYHRYLCELAKKRFE